MAGIPDLRGAGLAEVLASLRELVVALCEAFPGGRDRFPAFFALVAGTPELQDRERRKLGGRVEAIEAALRDRGVAPATAALAPQVALACFEAARRLAGPDLDRLVSEVGSAFDAVWRVRGQRALSENPADAPRAPCRQVAIVVASQVAGHSPALPVEPPYPARRAR